jgi:rare lipoprotein A
LLAKVGRFESDCGQDITNPRAPSGATPVPDDGKNMQAIKAFALTLAACSAVLLPHLARADQPDAAPAANQPAVPAARVLDEGVATWYGPRFARHATSNGEIFNPAAMTAAHPSLPLGTVVRVTDEDTGRSIVVRINDREPPHGIRCIDLSEGAARALGMRSRGVANVTISSVAASEPVEVAEAPDDDAPAVHKNHAPRRHH